VRLISLRHGLVMKRHFVIATTGKTAVPHIRLTILLPKIDSFASLHEFAGESWVTIAFDGFTPAMRILVPIR
jgi:hypothetical protein